METYIVVLVSLIFGLIFFNIINHKKLSILSFLLLFIIGVYYFIKYKFDELYLDLFGKIANMEKLVLIYCIITFIISIIEYIICVNQKEIKQEENIDNKDKELKNIKKEKVKSEKNIEEIDSLMVYLEMIDEPLACLINDNYFINNKMKKCLKINNYLIDKKKFHSFIHTSDKNSFIVNQDQLSFRLKIDGEYQWYDCNSVVIQDKKYSLIRKCNFTKNNKVKLKTFKELNNMLLNNENDNKDYYLVFFDINNIKDFINFYGKDFCNLIVSKHINDINELAYINDVSMYYISQNQYVIFIDNVLEYNILLSELENNSSILIKNDIIISDNKICVRGNVGAVASSNVKDKKASNVINKGFEMLQLANEEDYQGEYAIFHEVDEEVDYSLRDLNIDLDFDFSKYKKRLQ